MMTEKNREHIDTILVYQDGFSEPDGVFVSVFDQQVGLGLAGGGDVEVWLSLEECHSVLVSLQAAVSRAKLGGQNETFSDIYLQQTDDYGTKVPAIALVSDHRGEIGLYVAIKDNGGGQVWMGLGNCERLIAALQAASERL
jgi:hypothetical protein